ncbi:MULTISPECIES: xanthine dehydrogenase accessory protein XdhC [unclassified Caulobacter]|uniref:xanthine dehydrogenase accessory protein XdhC n=1 Tax=unclassified Caulobacter TaxID=2648921 RepID=UPI0006F88E60|nr:MULTISPECIES: xanthine dehydrogenase accessory protein XdhC [unclassified Caulobacter]KQV56483.1 chaperone XdhC [Caulobacter sp. Root342]KQV72118.1 chaperone XdhC [Caulobacter sp. Root343]
MRNWAREALARLDAHDEAALVTVLATEGSAPREAGTKMVVWRGGQSGTIGGGNLEHRAADQARRMLEGGQVHFAIQDYPLGPLLAQCCGGRVRLFLERLNDNSRDWLTEAAKRMDAAQPFEVRTRFDPGALSKTIAPILATDAEGPSVSLAGASASARGVRPDLGDVLVERADAPRPPLLLFGAGHVGQAVAKAFEPLPFRLSWYDSRPETADIGGVRVAEAAEMAAAAMGASSDAYGLVMTHDHALDYALVSAGLAGGGFTYLGVIGSKTKRARFMSRLRDDGFSEVVLTRLTCPIGLPHLKSKAPEVIAVSVAADLLMRQEAARIRNDEGLTRASI